MTEEGRAPVALSVAGSDSGGGAGLQADLKTWAALGVFGTSVVTCVTAQNTREVRSVEPIEPRAVVDQIRAVLEDLPVAAAKTGVLPSAEHVRVAADLLGGLPLVVDPVLVATSGDVLAAQETADAMMDVLLPRATLVTPNLAEAQRLTGRRVETVADMRDAARALVERGAGAVLLKGGHLQGAAVDVLVDEGGVEEFAGERVDVGPVHGTGCALSAAIAGEIARGRALRESIATAKHFVAGQLRASLSLGGGARVLPFYAPD